uniref:Uncharacterized protein n=1 Tax=Brassica oleracea var. oleracea TaxID=109376 RepID=A0A0D3E995_BRAOL
MCPGNSGFWKVCMRRRGELTNLGQEDNEEKAFPPPHTSQAPMAQLKRADNCALKEENYRIRYENDAIREALKYATKILTLMNRSFESKMLREE